MTARSGWWVALVVGLAAQGAYAQTAPVTAPEAAAAEPETEWVGDDDAEDAEPVAPSPPPELPAETPTARTSATAVWASGHWYWDGDQWRFNPGTWVEEMPGYQFVNGYWQQDGDDWRWVSGGWARPGSTEVEVPVAITREEVTATQAPPAVRQETPPPPPAPEYTWAPGYWYWTGVAWDWVGGSWLAPPSTGLVFVSPHWVHRGPSWVFVGGGWAPRGTVRVVVPVYRHAGIAVTFGHPNPFLRAWYRYPLVTWRRYPVHYHGGYRYGGYRSGSGYRYGGYRSPSHYPSHYYRSPGSSGGYRRYEGPRVRSSPGPRYHPATPGPSHGSSHGGGRGGRGDHGGGHRH